MLPHLSHYPVPAGSAGDILQNYLLFTRLRRGKTKVFLY